MAIKYEFIVNGVVRKTTYFEVSEGTSMPLDTPSSRCPYDGPGVSDRTYGACGTQWVSVVMQGDMLFRGYRLSDGTCHIKLDGYDGEVVHDPGGINASCPVYVGHYEYYTLWKNATEWNKVATYNGQTTAGNYYVVAKYNVSTGRSWSLKPGQSVLSKMLYARSTSGFEQYGQIRLTNEYTEPTPVAPTYTLSCDNNPSVPTSGTYDGSVDYGYCKNQSNSITCNLYSDSGRTQLITTKYGASGNFYNLAPNTTYYVTSTASNGCQSVSKNCSFTTVASCSISNAMATGWDSGSVRLSVVNGGGAYDPTTTIQIRKCGTTTWKTVATTTTKTVQTITFDGLEARTCYQVRASIKTSAGTYFTTSAYSPLEFTTNNKCVQANVRSIVPSLDESTLEAYTTVCVDWESFSSPVSLHIRYRVKDGYDTTWQQSETLDITEEPSGSSSVSGQHCFVLHDLFPNLTTYEFQVIGLAPQDDCELVTTAQEFTTPMVPEADPVKICDALTYMYELVCQSVKKLYDGNKTIYPNPTTQQLCDPYSRDPDLLTLWSRLLRLYHAIVCLICNMGENALLSGKVGQVFMGEVGWVDLLNTVVDPDDPDADKLVSSDGLLKYLEESIKSVWHYKGTVDVLVNTLDDLADYPDATSAIIASEDKVYKKQGNNWVEDTELAPEDFGVYHINFASDTAFGKVKAESGYYYWQGTWNNLDADLGEVEEQLKAMLDGSKNGLVNSSDTTSTQIMTVDKDEFSCAGLGGELSTRVVAFVTEALDAYNPVYYTVSYTLEDGTVLATQKVVAGSLARTPSQVVPGFTITGWSYNGEPFNFVTPIQENITLVATGEVETFVVSFSMNGGTGTEPADILVPYGTTITLPTAEDVGNNSLKGWMSSDGLKWDNSLRVYSDMELEAQWANTYTVTFNSNGGQPAIYPSQTVLEGGLAVEPEAPVKANVRFMGWYIGSGTPEPLEEIYSLSDVIVNMTPTKPMNYDNPEYLPVFNWYPGNNANRANVSLTPYDHWIVMSAGVNMLNIQFFNPTLETFMTHGTAGAVLYKEDLNNPNATETYIQPMQVLNSNGKLIGEFNIIMYYNNDEE